MPQSRTASKLPSAMVWLVVFGLAARIYHFLRDPGVWMDELFLLRNIASKGYADMTGPLLCDQAAPPLFLWIERTSFLLLGGSAMALRLVPLILSCLAVLLVMTVAHRCLRPNAVLWAVLLFAGSAKVVEHTVEAKQYMMDTFVAVLVPALFVATRDWRLTRRFLGFALLAPVVIFASYPACFVMGSLLMALLPELWENRFSRAAWASYALIGAATAAAFLALLIGPIRAQHTAELAGMWTEEFPDWTRPWTVPWWTVTAFGDGLDYSFRPVGWALLPGAIWGCVALWRRGSRAEAILLSGPAVLGLVGAWLGACPYHSRVTLYTTAPLSLLVAEGVAGILQRCRPLTEQQARWKRLLGGTLIAGAFVLMVLPVGMTALRIVSPPVRVVYPWPESADAK